jgi:hypothetical protein
MKNKGLIAPSISAANLGRLQEEVRNIEAAGADLIHIDVMDGVLVLNLTVGPWILDVVRSLSRLPIDCHLMVSRPGDWIPVFTARGAPGQGRRGASSLCRRPRPAPARAFRKVATPIEQITPEAIKLAAGEKHI